MTEAEWKEGKEIPCCPNCLQKGVLESRKGYIKHDSLECYFSEDDPRIHLLGRPKEEILSIRKEKWESFKAEKKKKWLGEIELGNEWIEQARYDTVILYPRLEKEETHWKDKGPQNCYRGMLGENWVHMMMEDLHIQNVTRGRPEEDPPFDFKVSPFRTISVKTSPFNENHVNIKKSEFHRSPTLYVLALQTCTMEKQPIKLKIEEKEYEVNDMKTFKILGYLLGQEVGNLKDEKGIFAEYYIAEKSDLKDSEELLDMLLEHSSDKPKESPKIYWKITLHKTYKEYEASEFKS